ncbi:hypothetical protein PC116_g21286 [Phytophthora cactorum]|uniref:Uncharacterized protein n=1 Tax=Phytophthora cactorum TaxID=29920 RepID=A0A8T1K044_9STRA|nr:hypothetical protein Pcac1_g21220 [Phytophthora cactorum]KAG2878954.1 hypothetical protein PC114_g22826 [Phytophthora cactorum]KAG2898352.1 hypothetical protein PC117_g22559 [Phytophthora cactorum]KAG2976060.1 hypothetical protein PC119_g22299 [Phytophthora cactorum]KAG3132008.1 hypothetical protein C6341_g23096 [Phytophthora cactorum]
MFFDFSGDAFALGTLDLGGDWNRSGGVGWGRFGEAGRP